MHATQKEPEPATSAVGVDVVGEEEKVEGEREEGEGETKAEVPYMEAEKKWWQVSPAVCLRGCYAMSGTDIARGAVCLRTCYAMSGTDIAHGAFCLRGCYAMSGTERGYGGTSRGSRLGIG
eukprot:2302444-Rhodomonas_salina.2